MSTYCWVYITESLPPNDENGNSLFMEFEVAGQNILVCHPEKKYLVEAVAKMSGLLIAHVVDKETANKLLDVITLHVLQGKDRAVDTTTYEDELFEINKDQNPW